MINNNNNVKVKETTASNLSMIVNDYVSIIWLRYDIRFNYKVFILLVVFKKKQW